MKFGKASNSSREGKHYLKAIRNVRRAAFSVCRCGNAAVHRHEHYYVPCAAHFKYRVTTKWQNTRHAGGRTDFCSTVYRRPDGRYVKQPMLKIGLQRQGLLAGLLPYAF